MASEVVCGRWWADSFWWSVLVVDINELIYWSIYCNLSIRLLNNQPLNQYIMMKAKCLPGFSSCGPGLVGCCMRPFQVVALRCRTALLANQPRLTHRKVSGMWSEGGVTTLNQWWTCFGMHAGILMMIRIGSSKLKCIYNGYRIPIVELWSLTLIFKSVFGWHVLSLHPPLTPDYSLEMFLTHQLTSHNLDGVHLQRVLSKRLADSRRVCWKTYWV